uniref:MTS domain-containing protein n=1 Tax=Macrostomum lignano TaxID=282301 RepID=A0A1I8JRX6_9PLAT
HAVRSFAASARRPPPPQPRPSSASTSATSAAEAQKFATSHRQLGWWGRAGPLQALHSLNRLRVPLVRTAASFARGPAGLADAELVDPRLRRRPSSGAAGPPRRPGARRRPGRRVRREAASSRRQQSAAAESGIADGRLTFRCQTVSELAADRPAEFDLARSPRARLTTGRNFSGRRPTCFGRALSGCHLPSTDGRLLLARVVAAERLLRLVPPGTHDWRLFIPPDQLRRCLAATAAWTRLTVGMRLNPLTGRWAWSRDLSLSYGLLVAGRAGPLQALHSLNRLRVASAVRTAASFARGPAGLADAELVDLGSAGGLLAEPLARLGVRACARASTRSPSPSRQRPVGDNRSAAAESGIADGRLTFRCQTVSELAADRRRPNSTWPWLAKSSSTSTTGRNFSGRRADLLRPGGCLVVTTIQPDGRLLLARGVVAAERLLRLVPPADSRLAAVHPA